MLLARFIAGRRGAGVEEWNLFAEDAPDEDADLRRMLARAGKQYSLSPIHRKPFVPYQLSMDNMITAITRFPLPAGVTANQIRAAFNEAAPGFRNVPGLVRKQFLYSKDCRTAGGVYLWNDEPAARAFMNERVAPMIRDKFQVDPAIEFYDSPVIVEN